MKKKSADLHGSAPEKSDTALLLIDVINDMEFPRGKLLLRHAVKAAEKMAALKRRVKRAGIPVIYVNDNFGRWKSDFRRLVDHCLQDEIAGKSVAQILLPSEDDYFVLKPKHSGFFSTSLDILLNYLEAKKLIICGFAGDICVLYTANDAYMRDFDLIIPRDCIASETKAGNEIALKHMKRFLKADTRASSVLRFKNSALEEKSSISRKGRRSSSKSSR